MRRRWPALAATIPLVLVWAVAIAHPASAAPLGVRPGGPVNSLSTPRQNMLTEPSGGWARGAGRRGAGGQGAASARPPSVRLVPC
jgi:hypothetical protein